MVINILMLTDNDYVSQVKVTMYSACKNTNSKSKLIFTILCDKKLNTISRKRLVSVKEKFSNVEVNFYEIEEEDFVNAQSDYRVPTVAYYRLVAAKALDVKKAIYLDSDLIVEKDLSELYEINIEKYYIAGVQDLYPVLNPNFALWYADNYNIANFSDYINSGVMLMNLELMRKDGIIEKFLNELKQKNLWVDQDIFNRVCSGKIRLIDWRFNHNASFEDEEYKWNGRIIEKKSGKEIIHYCGPSKPWNNLHSKRADVWWNIAKDILEEDIYNNLYRKALLGESYEKIAGFIEECMKSEKIVIVGYSEHGVYVKNALLRYGVHADILFCDNNPRKRGLMLLNQKIYSLEEAVQNYKEAIWINVIQKQRNQVIEQLNNLSIPKERIRNYIYE